MGLRPRVLGSNPATPLSRWGRLLDYPHEQHLLYHCVFLHMFAAPSVAGQPDRQCWKRSGQSHGIKTGQASFLSRYYKCVCQMLCSSKFHVSFVIIFQYQCPSYETFFSKNRWLYIVVFWHTGMPFFSLFPQFEAVFFTQIQFFSYILSIVPLFLPVDNV